MSSRACVSAAVTLLISCLAGPAWAQAQNLEAGKSSSQLFAGACNACHKSPRGLLKTVSPASLSGFLREHYTTSSDMASQLATYLISNGASDGRQAKQGADKQGQGGNDQADHQGRKNRNAPGQEAARPDDTAPPAEGGRSGRKRQARPAEPLEDGKPVANEPAQADTERGPDGRRLSAKQRRKPGKPPGAAEEPSVANEPPKTEPPKAEAGTDEKAKVEPRQETGNAAAKPETETKPRDEVKTEPARSEAAKTEVPTDNASGERPALRRDPVPAVAMTPAAPASTPAPTSAAAPEGASERAAPRPQAAAATAEPQAVTTPVSPPSPAGPPVPPISR